MAGDTRCGEFLVRHQDELVGAALWRKADNSLVFKTLDNSAELPASQAVLSFNVEIGTGSFVSESFPDDKVAKLTINGAAAVLDWSSIWPFDSRPVAMRALLAAGVATWTIRWAPDATKPRHFNAVQLSPLKQWGGGAAPWFFLDPANQSAGQGIAWQSADASRRWAFPSDEQGAKDSLASCFLDAFERHSLDYASIGYGASVAFFAATSKVANGWDARLPLIDGPRFTSHLYNDSDPDYFAAPVLFFRLMLGTVASRSIEPWRAVVQAWLPEGTAGARPGVGQRGFAILAELWKKACSGRDARGLPLPGTPWTFLPVLEAGPTSDADFSTSLEWLLSFDPHLGSKSKARLDFARLVRRMGSGVGQSTALLTFTLKDVAGKDTSLKLRVRSLSPPATESLATESLWSPPSLALKVPDNPSAVIESVMKASRSAGLVEAQLEIVAVESIPANPVRLGSLEVLFDKNLDARATVTLRLHGEWTSETEPRIAPEIVLSELSCKVNPMSGQDASNAENRVVLGDDDANEFMRRAFVEGDSFALGDRQLLENLTLTIHEKHGVDRNPVTELKIRRRQGSPVLGRHVSLQMRPLAVAAVEPRQFSEQSEDLIAQWRSDDAEGAQWRWGSQEITVSLPPSVSEEHERGLRFWSGESPYIDGKSLKYRFTTPAVLTVVSGDTQRRYNRSGQNLDWVMADAEVNRFRAEPMYPVVARFRRDKDGLPRVRVREAAERFGAVAEALPPIANHPFGPRLLWDGSSDVRDRYTSLRVRHALAAYNYRSRLAQYELYDHYRPQGLALDRNIDFTIRRSNRDPAASAPTLDPLPLAYQPAKETDDWKWTSVSIPQGGIRTGVLHTLEFPSELEAVLRTPASQQGMIESLSFSALGINGTTTAMFDEGRTHFTVTMNDGQAHRVVKTRIGRVGVLWNRAKHVIVYDRSVLPSEQFEQEQSTGSDSAKVHPFDGWPILRKSEEYVELLEHARRFAEEKEAEGGNKAGCIEGSEFFTRRIAVNGAWGRDFGTGYEIPLWNPRADPGNYPKPNIALRGQVDASLISHLTLIDPSQLVFSTSTVAGTGTDSDKWAAIESVDFIDAARPGLSLADQQMSSDAALESRLRPASPIVLGWERFNLWVRGEALDVMAGRSEKPVYVRPERVLLARSSQKGPGNAVAMPESETLLSVVARARPDDPQALPASIADAVSGFRADMESKLRECLARFGNGIDCAGLRAELQATLDAKYQIARDEVTNRFDEANTAVTNISNDISRLAAEKEKLARNLRVALLQPFDAVETARRDIRRLLEDKRRELDGSNDVPKKLKDALTRLHELAIQEEGRLFEALASSYEDKVITTITDWVGVWKGALQVAHNAIQDGQGGTVAVRARLVDARRQLNENVIPKVPKVLRSGTGPGIPARLQSLAAEALQSSCELVDCAINHCDEGTGMLQATAAVAASMKTAAGSFVAKADAIRQVIVETKASVASLTDKAKAKAAAVLDELKGAIDSGVKNPIMDALAKVLDKTDWSAGWLSARKDIYEAEIQSTIDGLSRITDVAIEPLLKGTQASRIALESTRDAALNALAGARSTLDAAIKGIAQECTNAKNVIEDALNTAEKDIRTRVAEVEKRIGRTVEDAVQSELGRKIKENIAVTQGVGDKGDKLVKLAKLLGSPPELPTLTFNRDRIDYVFSDLEQQVTTSPMAARLREIDGALNELGLSIPTRALAEQIVLDSLKGLDVRKVFKDLAGLRFDHLFPGMRLPDLSSDKVKITHDVDARARSAWVCASVDVPFPQELTAFGGPVPLRVANARFKAEVKMETTPGGVRSHSFGSIRGDWSLTLGSERLATFRDVGILFSSDGGLQFDISMERVTLHPTVQFVSEYAKSLGKKLPPGLEVVKRDGMPVGVKANISNPVPGFNTGFFAVGPFILSSGFSLMLKTEGAPQGVEIQTFVDLGSRKQPFLLQIGWLTGAAWLQARARLTENGSLLPEASVGFAAGTGRSVTVAGVAHATYSFLFFLNATATPTSSSLEVGIRVSGEARLLGYLSASILLELVARSQDGSMKGYGTLDVEIDICWCYSVHIVRTVEQDI